MRPSAPTPRRVVYTAIIGGKDKLREPRHILPDTDYVCFTDNPHLTSRVFELRPLPFEPLGDARLTARRLKLMPHLWFPHHRESLWIDGSILIRADISSLWQRALSTRLLAGFAHPSRHCLFAEALECARTGRAPEAALTQQASAYRAQGMPENFGLIETSILFRRHHAPRVVAAMELWWQEISAQTARDQVSLPFILWRQNITAEFLPYLPAHDTCFVQYPHARHTPGDNRAPLASRLREWCHTGLRLLGVPRSSGAA